jgi:hypothetical protein
MRIVIDVTPRAQSFSEEKEMHALENGRPRGELGSRALCPGWKVDVRICCLRVADQFRPQSARHAIAEEAVRQPGGKIPHTAST